MEQQMNMFEIEMKALELSLREELRADTEKRVRVVKERVNEKIKEVVPQCAVVKEIRGESYAISS